MSQNERDFATLTQSPGDARGGIARFRDNLEARVEDEARLRNESDYRYNLDYQYNRGRLRLLQEHERSVTGAASQLDLVAALGRMQRSAQAALAAEMEDLRTNPVHRGLHDQLRTTGLLHETDSSREQVREARTQEMRRAGNFDVRQALARLEALESAADGATFAFEQERGRLIAHARTLGISNPTATVDAALNARREADETMRTTGGGTTVPRMPTDSPTRPQR